MKICIVGAGAIGGWFAARLAGAGHEVSVIARGAHLEAIRAKGLRLEQGGRLTVHPVAASERPEDFGVQDFVFVTLKYIDIEPLMERVRAMLGADTAVVSAMNGVPWWFLRNLPGPLVGQRLETVDRDGRISAAIDDARVIGLTVRASCSVPEPGLIRHGNGTRIIVGAPSVSRGGTQPERVKALAGMMQEAGYACEASDSIHYEVWSKVVGNLSFNPVAALTGGYTDWLIENPETNAVCAQLVGEAFDIGRRLGFAITQTPAERIAETRLLGHVKSSMLQDAERRKPLELDAILGVVVEIGERLGLSVPYMKTLLALARMKDRMLREPA
ncbi:MAG: 2-dehydropantoate 2-reductase [Betaproteobacteria bacterium]|nr:2-dehydropantoate 2-reductase [Betaproteobacteria bacterium]